MLVDGHQTTKFGVVFSVVALVQRSQHGPSGVIHTPSHTESHLAPTDGQGFVVVGTQIVGEGPLTNGLAQQLAIAKPFNQCSRAVMHVQHGLAQGFAKKAQLYFHAVGQLQRHGVSLCDHAQTEGIFACMLLALFERRLTGRAEPRRSVFFLCALELANP